MGIIASRALQVLLCLSLGITASFFSASVTVGEDRSQIETVGVISYRGFPLWYKESSEVGIFYPARFKINWYIWTAFFLIICYGIHCVIRMCKRKSAQGRMKPPEEK